MLPESRKYYYELDINPMRDDADKKWEPGG
jgi:hypothetical protein